MKTASSILLAFGLLGLSPAPVMAQSFGGYPCTVDCSGHEAGYEWAQRKGISSSYGCGGNSQSFIEGCKAWTEENEYGGGDLFGDEGEDDGLFDY